MRVPGIAAALSLLPVLLTLESPLGPGALSSPQAVPPEGAFDGKDAELPVGSAPRGTVNRCAPPATAGYGDPEYYAFELFPTGSLPRARNARGRGTMRLAPSPFDLPLTVDGRFRTEVEIQVEGVDPGLGRVVIAWIAPPTLEPLVRLGEVDGEGGRVGGIVSFEKFIVFVTVEPEGRGTAERWSGPIVLRGTSRSARLQSMASHGFFEQEPC